MNVVVDLGLKPEKVNLFTIEAAHPSYFDCLNRKYYSQLIGQW